MKNYIDFEDYGIKNHIRKFCLLDTIVRQISNRQSLLSETLSVTCQFNSWTLKGFP